MPPVLRNSLALFIAEDDRPAFSTDDVDFGEVGWYRFLYYGISVWDECVLKKGKIIRAPVLRWCDKVRNASYNNQKETESPKS